MYLKKIEIHGFKSFANKIVFDFHDGITGIVGPNGSGKSNVADAVRWVLGEQRVKQLRGANMQDVIFAGTEMRKPLGFAYVAITLDNSDHSLNIDFEEVTVARRIYRSGESEYMINGAACRLKDVSELFYDTGIGKEGYSIIGQGQIDKILSGKPEERRELFDEAAGIVKFKKRKNLSQKKLEDERANLTRVTDILAELEKQVGPLERQSETAKIYLKKKEELKTLDVNMFLLENQKTTTDLSDVEKKYEIVSGDYDTTKAKYDNIKEEFEKVQVEIAALEEQIAKERETLTSTSEMRVKLEGQINLLKEKINSAQSNEGHFKSRQESVAEQLKEKQAEREKLILGKKVVDDQIAQLSAQRDESLALQEKLIAQIEQLNQDIESGKNTIIQTINERGSIKARIERFDGAMEQFKIRKAELNSKLLSIKSDEEEHKAEYDKLEKEFIAINDEIIALNDEISSLEEQNSLMSQTLAKKDQELRDLQVVYHQKKSKLEAVSNFSERYEGYGQSVRRVLEQKEHTSGILGTVADLIKVEQKYEIAIETALGGNIQNIVTEDEDTAKDMIAFLKKNKFGRATFLPLTSITNPQEFKTPEVLDEKGVIGMACDLVTTQKRHVNVAKAMLGRIVVVDHFDNAVKIARKFDQGVRMVTLEGELFVPGGAISGGAFKNASNLLSRSREIEELEKKVKELLKEVDAKLADIEDTKKQRNEIRRNLENTKETLQKQFLAQNTARLNLNSAEEKMNDASQGYSGLKDDYAEVEKKIEQIKADQVTAQKELEQSEELEKNITKQIEAFQKELETAREKEENQAQIVATQDAEIQKIRIKQDFEQENVNRLDGEISRVGSELDEIETTLKTSLEDVDTYKQNIKELEETILASETAKDENQQKLQEDEKHRVELNEKQKSFFDEREELSSRMNALDLERARLSGQKEKLEEHLEGRINYMWDEYEITLSDAAKMRDESMTDLPAMKKQVSEISDDIKKLGNVNVNAIEDYKNLMERYTFLKTQHDDLIEAEKTLLNIIEELDTAMRKQFTEKFADIGKEFDKVFKELFGGGKGTLELMEDQDILEAGIRIIAQPPGKKLQNMMQLSGGEKALTAIALLFAIQNLKPSPFCLLDEIEAALDDSNVGRYASYLHKLTKHTQFIVITHRRGTMEKADRLYGITMMEKGVSTLVSVNLIDQDLTD